MIEANGAERRWSIGELAKASGLTVRTLHHYDEIGLLSAGERTAAGHRRYTGRDLRRLYRVRALRALGLSLEEVSHALAGPADDLAGMRDLLAAQLRDLDAHAVRIQVLKERIHGLLGQIDAASMPDPEDFMATLERMSMFENYFTPEQQQELAERREALGPEAIEAAKREWAGLVNELLSHVAAGTPVDDPQARTLVERWDAVAQPFHRSEGTKVAAQRMWDENSAALSRALPWTPEQMTGLVAYVNQVRESR
ncbi:MerR family transcriptional regulator [Sphaerisporangium aureirubrum]|uniref:MerR family transcriptional regulator n=1 Tax=Sphaerisporangium aureirubrum TaxID=1544736 RepID=A0ABW1NR08_9ACTN